MASIWRNGGGIARSHIALDFVNLSAEDRQTSTNFGGFMKEILRIQGGVPLRGHVKVSGSKNAAVALIPAALLADSPCTIENLPDIEDVHMLIAMLECLNVGVEFQDGVLRIDPTTIRKCELPAELATRMRASYYLLPVLTGMFSCAHVPLPGGCSIGNRPLDQTVKGMTLLGANVVLGDEMISATTEGLHGGDVYLDIPSVGATINTMLTAVKAVGATTIHNAAKEPHIVDVANFLNSMGARIKGAGTSTIRIAGDRELHGSTYAAIPDQIETGTYMIAAAATGGDVFVHGAIPVHMEALTAKLLEMGVYVDSCDDEIHVRATGPLRAVNIKTQAYPGFPTDLQQPMTTLLTTANGDSNVTETIFESRFAYTHGLSLLGASIEIADRVATVHGASELKGASVEAPDLRGGAALVIAGLIAEGVTEISEIQYIMRGYEYIDQKLRALGADVERLIV